MGTIRSTGSLFSGSVDTLQCYREDRSRAPYAIAQLWKRKGRRRRRPSSQGLNSYWTTHSMLEPALIALGFNPCPKLGGGVTCGRLGGGGMSRGGRLRLLENAACPTPTSCSTPPAMNAIAPSATVTYTPGASEFGGDFWPGGVGAIWTAV